MSGLTQEQVRAWLDELIDEASGRPITDGGALRSIGIDGDRLAVDLVVGYPAQRQQEAIAARVRAHLLAKPGVAQAVVGVGWRVHAHQVQSGLTPMPEVRNIIAVASGKGGVGKSTTAVNLALALAAEGARVGLLDADIYGPSLPRMMGLSGRPDSPDGKSIIAKENHGVQCMSIGFLIDEDTPMIWRGPMVTQALQQLLGDTRWQNLDYLIIDLPPGTGDIQLTLCQRVPVSGAIIVTTPQDIALLDARKALRMFEKVNVPVLGVVENMSLHVCSNCGHAEPIFGEGGGARMASDYEVRLLGQLPLDIRIREQADSGTPTVAALPDSELADRYRAIARATAGELSTKARNKSLNLPNIVISST